WRSGLIVTANHTVRVDEDITVTRPDGRAIAATLAGRDPAIDVAVLKVDAPEVAVADLGESNAVRVGHLVLAGGRGPCASWGVVSAIGEGRGPRSAGGALFSLDLTLYPGFSGGPLVNAQGQVIGVNSSGTSRHLQLAIPSAAVTRVVDELVRRGRLARPYLGVGTQPVSLPEALRQRFNLEQPTAVIVVAVQPSSPAASAGLLMGDVIVSLGGTSITDRGDRSWRCAWSTVAAWKDASSRAMEAPTSPCSAWPAWGCRRLPSPIWMRPGSARWWWPWATPSAFEAR